VDILVPLRKVQVHWVLASISLTFSLGWVGGNNSIGMFLGLLARQLVHTITSSSSPHVSMGLHVAAQDC
jgi:hypothetical protein